MTFDTDKQRYLEKLGKPDNSKKGGVDEAAWSLLDAINAHDDYYTTSSCSGRMSLFVEAPDGRKDHADWHFVTHETSTLQEVQPFLSELPSAPVWFKFEAAIFHVVARDEAAANQFLRWAKEAGFKHSGLQGTEKRFMIELIDSERIDVPVALDGRLIVEEKFIKFLIGKANEKLRITHERMEKLRKLIS